MEVDYKEFPITSSSSATSLCS